MSTKKRSTSKPQTSEMRAEYRFDYSKARPNRFAARLSREAVAVVLEPDVAKVFHTSESVNEFLRSAIKAMPERARKRRAG